LQRSARHRRHVGDAAVRFDLQAVTGDELACTQSKLALLDADIHVEIAQRALLGQELTGAHAQL
jgi:hypothetical protein